MIPIVISNEDATETTRLTSRFVNAHSIGHTHTQISTQRPVSAATVVVLEEVGGPHLGGLRVAIGTSTFHSASGRC